MSNLKLQAGRAQAVVPSDTTDIYFVGSQPEKVIPCVLYVGVGGNLRVMTAGGDDVIFLNVQNGAFIPVNVVRVFATNTNATGIVALW
jgi:hypothetical protein